MGQEEVNRIKEKFSKLKLSPEYLEHEEVLTSIDVARTRGFELKQGIKAILLMNGNEFVIVDIPADKKVDVKEISNVTGWSRGKTKMETEEEVMNVTNCRIGAVPPFGHKTQVKIFVDERIYENEISTFNIGLRTKSVKIPTREIKILFDSLGVTEEKFVKL